MERSLMNSLTNPFTTRTIASSLAWGTGAGAAAYIVLHRNCVTEGISARQLAEEELTSRRFSSLIAIAFGIGNLALEAFSKLPIFLAVAGAYLISPIVPVLVATASLPHVRANAYHQKKLRKFTINMVKESIALGALAMLANRLLKRPENFWNVTGLGTKGLLVAARTLWPFIKPRKHNRLT